MQLPALVALWVSELLTTQVPGVLYTSRVTPAGSTRCGCAGEWGAERGLSLPRRAARRPTRDPHRSGRAREHRVFSDVRFPVPAPLESPARELLWTAVLGSVFVSPSVPAAGVLFN